MDKFDEKKLNDLLEGDKLDEARVYVENVFGGQPEVSDKADVAIEHAVMYLKIMNRINKKYLESLKNLEELLNDTQKADRYMDDNINIVRLKADLAS